ncbi:retrovirus-related pol polyprotein from transposon TNT 1-94, partial [Tanacetum coccineum]
SPSTALEKKTPMDLWSGHPANYEMLRIFGFVAYLHANQWKLKPRAIKCIFLRDVVFNESLMYKDTLKGAGAADSMKEVEFEVELQGSRVEPTMDPHTGENPGNEDEEQNEGPQQHNLDNYEAINSSENDEWVRAMEEEMSSLKKNHTWELVDQPSVRHTSIRVILSLTACEDYELEQLDVKTAFLHGNLKETIYMRQPPGFEEETGNLSVKPWTTSMFKAAHSYLIGCDSELAKLHISHPRASDKVEDVIIMHIDDLQKFSLLRLADCTKQRKFSIVEVQQEETFSEPLEVVSLLIHATVQNGLWQEFSNVYEFREALQRYAMANGIENKLKKNDTNRSNGALSLRSDSNGSGGMAVESDVVVLSVQDGVKSVEQHLSKIVVTLLLALSEHYKYFFLLVHIH